MKYELVSLSVVIKSKLIRKEEKKKIDDKTFGVAECRAAYAAGFIKPEGTKARTPAEVVKQYQAEKAKPEEPEKPKDVDPVKDDKPKADDPEKAATTAKKSGK